jgi:hypothetical protein
MDNDDLNFSYTLPPNIRLSDSFPPGGYYLSRTQGPLSHEVDPLFIVSLVDMTKLVKEVIGGPFGIELDLGENDSFQGNVLVKIPAFGFSDYTEGELVDGKLRFANTPVDGKFIPKKETQGGNLNENEEIEIFVKVTGSCSGTIAPEMVFEWERVTINTEDYDSLEGEFELENLLGEFLGSSVSFKDVYGYIYVNNVGSSTTLTLTSNGVPFIASQRLIEKSRPIFTGIIEDIPAQSLADPISLANVLNSNATLGYQFNIPEMTIEYDEETIASKTITVDLVVLLPLEFRVSGLPPSSEPEYAKYVKLELDGILPELGDDDLFLRESKNDSFFSNLSSGDLILERLQNNILEGKIFILVSANDGYSNLFEFKQGGRLILDMDNLPYPFAPKFDVILEKDNKAGGGYEDYATLKILRVHPDTPRIFEFTLAAEIHADINETINF